MNETCSRCGAEWTAGRFSAGCEECGGGAMTRDCPRCGGVCGAVWRRAPVDSHDSGEAHWVGACAAASEWWLDASSLPDLLWARLLVGASGETAVMDLDGAVRRFRSRALAVEWLRADEYETLADLCEDGAVPADARPPSEFPRRA